jgi:hypothetical protein
MGRVTALGLLLSLAVLNCAVIGRAVGAADPGLLKAALVANQASLDAFPTYKCRFTWTKAAAKSEQAALRGEYEGATSCDFMIVADGGKHKFQALTPSAPRAPQKPIREKDGRYAVSHDFIPICDLKFKDQSLRYFRPFQQATVATGRPEDPGAPSPLDLICSGSKSSRSPAKLFLHGQSQNPVISGDGHELLDGCPIIHVRGRAVSIDHEYYFDPSRGYWPLKFVSHCEPPWAGEKQDIVVHLVKAQQCSRQRWFPMMWLQLTIFPKRGSVLVSELRVTELDVDNKPSDEDFSVVLDAGTSVETLPQGVEAPHSFRLRQPEKITPDDIPRLAGMLATVAEVPSRATRPLTDTAVHSSRPFAWLKWSLIGSGCLVFVVAVLVYRRREVARVSPP